MSRGKVSTHRPPTAAATATRRARSGAWLDEVEAVARIGSYSTDFTTGNWVSSKGLDAIFGIDAAFERSVEGWASLIHPADRDAMVSYLTDEVLGRAQPFEKDYRIVRADTGEERWVHGRGELELDGSGRPVRMIGTIADVTDRHRAESRARRLAAAVEQSAEGIVITDPDLRIVYANGAYARSVGRLSSELVGLSARDVVAIGLDAPTIADMSRAVRAGQRWVAEVDHRIPDGTLRRFEANITPTYDADGDLSSWVGVIRDVTERRAAETALKTSEQRLRTAFDTMLEGMAVMSAVRDDDGAITDFRIDYANAAIGAISGVPPTAQVGRMLLELFPAHRSNGLFDSYARLVETGVPYESAAVHYVDPDAAGGSLDQVLEQRAARLGDGCVLSVRDVTEHHHAERELRRLATAIEQSSDAVVITDAGGVIEYVNPAFEHVTGYSSGEAVGQNPRILKSGVQGSAYYAAMWAALTSGQSFVGDLTNRRKDGSLFQEEAVISPIRDDAGTVTSYVAVKRDVTRERAFEAAQARLARERALIAGMLADLRVMPTPDATADLICRHVVSLAGVSSGSLAYFSLKGPVISLAFVRADGVPVPLRRLPFQRSRTIRERAAEGPWVEAWAHRSWHPYDRLHTELGTRALGYAPIRHGGRLIGLLTVTSSADDAVERLTETLPALLEFAGFAGALVGPGIAGLTEAGSVRARIAEVIRTAAFRPVFQPIVDLATGAHVGYEALTRFSSGTGPDVVFADARAAGLESELELATLGAAISAAAGLPPGGWLSLNVSPALVTQNGALARLLRKADRPVVIEVTEHVPVVDYAALRTAIGRLRPEVRVAVDDAGAGVANFGHIVELRPAFVKLDIGLVRGIDSDLSRRALMVGLLHFAAESASQTIAEGVETELELATLRRLGVPFAQGYLLGRPQAVTTGGQ